MSQTAEVAAEQAPTRTSAGTVLRLEGAAVALAAAAAFQMLDGSWIWFAALFLVPDLSVLGYFRGPRVGATVYNIAHTYLCPAALLGLWFLLPQIGLLRVAAIWSAHIGLDRMLGYGLKDPSGFKHTHLQRV